MASAACTPLAPVRRSVLIGSMATGIIAPSRLTTNMTMVTTTSVPHVSRNDPVSPSASVPVSVVSVAIDPSEVSDSELPSLTFPVTRVH